MKQLEITPHFICKPNDTNLVAYIDTDSVYVNAIPIMEHLVPNINSLDDKQQDEVCEKIALKYQDKITEHYDTLANNIFNIPNMVGGKTHKHMLEMKTEAVIRSAYFRATRRYAQWITKKEGIVKEELDIKGLEFMKANFPPLFGNFFNKVLEEALRGKQQKEIVEEIREFKDKVLDSKQIPLLDLGNPTSVKTIENYAIKKKNSQIFSDIKSKASAPVKAAIRHNDLIDLWGLSQKHNYITLADKVKWIYLKDNPYKIDALAFLPYDVPKKIMDYLEKYADRERSIESILLSKLEGFFDDLEWDLNLNPYLDEFNFFEI